MSDVRDILGAPKLHGEKAEAAPKPKKAKIERPKGMSREAFALLGDQHPIISSQLAEKGKKDLKAKPKPSTKGVVVWNFKGFRNSARDDGLELKRWTKAYKDAAGRVRDADDSNDYSFAKFNKKIQLARYNDEEYDSLVKSLHSSHEWSREETDYLLTMCERFDLRFNVIADRYEYVPSSHKVHAHPRTLDDLKERYYAVARALFIGREGGEAPIANQVLVKHPFNKQHEVDRKRAIEQMLERTAEQLAEENALLAEAKAVEEKRKAEAAAAAAAARRAAAQPVAAAGVATPAAAPVGAPAAIAAGVHRLPDAFSNDPGPGVSSFFDANCEPARPKPGVYARGMSTTTLGGNIIANVQGGARGQKAMETLMAELAAIWPGVQNPPRVSTRAVCGSWLALRNEIVALHELRRTRLPGGGVGGATDDKKSSKKRR
mmetsp:Transcript_29148/g.74368  ORF Transcript_29148/g.74368 Transcript_29148/m.74368 type:complete len:433 (-) Transcript_29148:246-1544(-)|eukprot:CAMPEP_0202858898 /NCGR_PEP_ID=MMETSP1391-20130828/1234_1 /ASSEMBLY_ACC=CAM_ASM_000867 /TAXON_ID=1034604 /ORGANISM="Chlamydomonas leiostraca, Strain SAG 11-49" /LENGTH=432 /DNA_ID=CAMNT_0049537873 /DNA_START=120 /DNA_END=1418 /DNA_ORIENTATION=-